MLLSQTVINNYLKILVLALLLALLVLFSACQSTSSVPPANVEPATPTTADPATAVATTIVDGLGRTVTIKSSPQRIVSLAPNLTEMVFAVGQGQKLVGVTNYCDYPEAARQITAIGDTLHPDIEKIITLKPDLVLVSTASQLEQPTAKLTALGIAVFVVKTDSLAAVLQALETIGQLTQAQLVSRQLVTKLRARLAALTQKVQGLPRPKVFLVVGIDPLITAGQNNFITDLIELAGGESISKDVVAEWPTYSVETVVAQAPEIIILPAMQPGETPLLPDSLKTTPAVQKQHTYSINGDLLFRPGPRLLDGLEVLVNLFHPTNNPNAQ
jgi:iron complex transport system substrate-binding protein